MPLNDRMYYLAQALTSAKSAASLGVEDVEFTSSLQERIDVAQVQSEVGRGIASHKEMTPTEKNDSLLQLDSRLLGLDDVGRPALCGMSGRAMLTVNFSCIKTTLDHSDCTNRSCLSSKRPIRALKMSAKQSGDSCLGIRLRKDRMS